MMHVTPSPDKRSAPSVYVPTPLHVHAQPAVQVTDLSYFVGVLKPWRCVLDAVTVSFHRGQVTAIMGPSDEATSSLLDLVAHRRKYGRMYGNISIHAHSVGYVEQPYAHMGSLSVIQNLEFAARLSLSPGLPAVQYRTRATEAAVAVGLFPSLDKTVGDYISPGLTDGEKRLLGIASELISKPDIICMATPTSDLVASSAVTVAATMSKLAKSEGRAIIATISGPSTEVLNSFDKVILVSQGKVIYHGAANTVQDRFGQLGYLFPSRTSIAEAGIEMASSPALGPRLAEPANDKDNIHKLEQRISGYTYMHPRTSTHTRTYRDVYFTLVTLVRRVWLDGIRNILGFRFLACMHLALGVGLGVVYLNEGRKIHESFLFNRNKLVQDSANDVTALLFLMIVYRIVLTSLGIPSMYLRRQVGAREMRSRLYGPLTYLSSVLIVYIPFLAIAGIVCGVITRELVGIPGEWSFYLAVTMFSSVLSYLQAFTAVAVARAAFGAFGLNFMYMIPSLLLAGLFRVLPTLPYFYRKMSNLFYVRWAFELGMINTFRGERLSGFYLSEFEFDNVDRTQPTYVLVLNVLVFAAVIYLGLYPRISTLQVLAALPDTPNVNESDGTTVASDRSTLEVDLLEDDFLETDINNAHLGVSYVEELNTHKQPSVTLLTLPERQQVTLAFFDVSCSTNPDNRFMCKRTHVPAHLVQNIYGEVQPGQSCAIIGPPGSGKTSLLDIIAGNRPTRTTVTAQVSINGDVLDMHEYRRMRVYVPQRDANNPNLTVRESLEFAVMLRLGDSINNHLLESKVDNLLGLVNLTEVQHMVVGRPGARNISAAQVRILTIAVELSSEASLVLLDDPTFDLPPLDVYLVAHLLATIAQTARTVVCTLPVNEPSERVLNQFSKVLLLAKGHLIYFGAPGDATSHFQSLGYRVPQIRFFCSTAELIIDVCTMRTELSDGRPALKPEALRDAFWNSDQGFAFKSIMELNRGALNLSPGPNRIPDLHTPLSELAQAKLLLRRQFKSMSRMPFWSLALRSLSSGIVVGTVFLNIDDGDNLSRLSSFPVSFLSMALNLAALIPVLHDDIHSFARERFSGVLHIRPFWLCLRLEFIPVMALYILVFTSVMYNLADLRGGTSHFLTFFMTMFLCNWAMMYQVHLIVTLTSAVWLSGMLYMVLLLCMLTFSGQPRLISIMPWWMKWITYVNPARWNNEALFVNEFKDNAVALGTVPYDDLSDQHEYSFQPVICWSIIIAIGVVYKLAGLAALIITQPRR